MTIVMIQCVPCAEAIDVSTQLEAAEFFRDHKRCGRRDGRARGKQIEAEAAKRCHDHCYES